MKVLLTDSLAPAAVHYLNQQVGLEVVEAHGFSEEQRLQALKSAVALIVRSQTQVTQSLLAQAPQLRVVGRAGVGVDNIDLTAASERGIVVMNTPEGNTMATVELTFAHLLCASRPVVGAAASMVAGKWNRGAFSGSQLFQKTLGVVGLGRIGSELARRAQAFGMRVLAYDPYVTEVRAKALGVERCDLDTLLQESDYITVHMPLVEETRGMFNAAAFAKMKTGVRIVNCARGGIVDEAALVAALQSGKVAAAGLDVFEVEPLPAESELRKLPGLTLTPHLGAATREAQESVGLEIASAVASFLLTGAVRGAVNVPSVDAQTREAVGPYLLLGEKLGAFLQQVTSGEVQRLQITAWGKEIQQGILPLSRAIQKGYLLGIGGSSVNEVNAPFLLKRLGIAVDSVHSTGPADYTELVQVEAFGESERLSVIKGTLFGKAQSPRVVALKDHAVEVLPQGPLLVLENRDVPGIVGRLGTLLGKEGINIARLSLSRCGEEKRALSIYGLDNVPSEGLVRQIASLEAVETVRLVRL